MSNPVAIRTNEELDETMLLGHILFMTIDDVRIHKDDLAALFSKHNLSSTFLPEEIKPHDAFRRATAKAQQATQINYNGVTHKARLMVREVVKDDKVIIRHLVRELIDEKNVTTEYATVGKMEFSRDTEHMNISWDAAYLNEFAYDTLLKDTEALFVDWTQFHTRETVRNIMNKVIKSMHPLSIMQGGRAQFVPKMNRDILYNMKAVVEELPGGSLAEVIPMIDTQDQRDMLTRNLEQEVLADVDSLLNDFSNLLQGGSVRSAQVKRYAANFAALQEKTDRYEALLHSKMTVIQSQLQQALQNIVSTPVSDSEDN